MLEQNTAVITENLLAFIYVCYREHPFTVTLQSCIYSIISDYCQLTRNSI